MTRFDIGVVTVTFVALAVAAIIRNIVVPAVRRRVGRHRLAALESKLAERQLTNHPRVHARDRSR